MSHRLLVVLVFMLIACKPANLETKTSEPVEDMSDMKIPEDFRTFYDRFHSDTSFQLEHIVFPLSGIPANSDTLTAGTNYKWQKEGWRWHRPIDPTLTGFEQEWQMLTQDLIIETISQRSAGFGMMRRFAKMDTGWMLIYYAGMNPL